MRRTCSASISAVSAIAFCEIIPRTSTTTRDADDPRAGRGIPLLHFAYAAETLVPPCTRTRVCPRRRSVSSSAPPAPSRRDRPPPLKSASIPAPARRPPTSALLPIRLESLSDPAHAWSAEVESGQSVRFRLVPPGRYRIVSGAVERPIEVASGDEVTISVSRIRPGVGRAETRHSASAARIASATGPGSTAPTSSCCRTATASTD